MTGKQPASHNGGRLIELLFSQYRSIYLIVCVLAVLGIKALLEMPSAIYPPLSFPRVVVVAESGDKAPDQVAVQVTRPLEEAISTVPRIRRIRSKTIRGSSELSIEFLEGTDMVQSLSAIQGKIAAIQSSLPPDLALTVERLTPGAFPVMTFNISSHGLPLTDLQDIVKYQVLPVLRRVPGVSRVLSNGGDIREIEIETDPKQLREAHLTPALLADTLRKTNQIGAVGKIQSHYQQPLILQDSVMPALSDFLRIAVIPPSGMPLALGSVASVRQGIQPQTGLVSGPRGYCIGISILKQPTANMLTVSHDVLQAVSRLKTGIAQDVQIDPVYDQAALVKDSVNNVKEAILIGTLLIIGVLFLFLRSWRTTLLAALTIPLTVLCTFWVMSLSGQDFNLMSLGGLAVAIGLVIDDAIVVIENIYRHMHLAPELPLNTIIRESARELIAPVISSTLTTVVVFLPLGLLSGVAGQFFQSFSFTLGVAVLVSLVLALGILQLLAQRMLLPPSQHHNAPQNTGRLESLYIPYLQKALRHPAPQIIGISLLLVIGGCLAFTLPTGFMPDMDEGSYVLDYFSPPGTSLQTADRIASKIEGMLAKTPDVAGWSRRTGAEMGFFATEQSRGDILVRLKPKGKRHHTIFQIIDAQRAWLASMLPGVEIGFVQILQDQLNDLAGAPSPLEIKVYGEQPAVLESIAKTLERRMEHIPGIADIKLGTQLSSPEIHLKPIPQIMAQAGLTPDDVRLQLETGILGTIVNQYRLGDKFINVRLKYPAHYRDNLPNLPIFAANGGLLPLSALETVTHESGPGQIQRENQQRYISVEGAPEKRDLGSIQTDLFKLIDNFQLPNGYRLEIGGLYESQHQAFLELLQVLLLSGLLVFTIMVFQFQSFIKPVLILSLIPIALSGVVIVLWLTQIPLNVSSLMGMVLLIGLIVKNGIILMSYADQLQNGENIPVEEAIQTAARTRLRPIFMTTLATMLGLLPLALGWGSGAELQKPLAVVVIGGLLFSTFLSLTFLPWLYLKILSPHRV